jgi:hypothetical protein
VNRPFEGWVNLPFGKICGVALAFALGAGPAVAAGADRAPGRLDVRDFGAKLDGVADDSPAWIAAIRAANAQAAGGRPVCIYQPAGVARLVEPLPMFVGPGCVQGDGSFKSILKLDRSYAGDVFSWSEAWMAQALPMQASTAEPSAIAAGPSVVGIGIIGDRSSASPQNGFVFYDRADFVSFRDVAASYLNGRCLYSGAPRMKQAAYLRESKFYEVRFWACGSHAAPAVEFDSAGPGPEASNEISVFGMDIVFPHGDGLVIRNSSAGVVRLIQFHQLRVEGIFNPREPVEGDLVRIGDASSAGVVRSISIEGFDAEVPYADYAALRISGPNPGSVFDIDVDGSIGPGPGGGVALDAGRSLRLRLEDIGTTGPKISAGARLGRGIVFDGEGAAAALAGRPELWDRLNGAGRNTPR